MYVYSHEMFAALLALDLEALIYQRTAKYKTDYIDSTFTDFEHDMFSCERILECMFWQHILDYEVQSSIFDLSWDDK